MRDLVPPQRQVLDEDLQIIRVTLATITTTFAVFPQAPPMPSSKRWKARSGTVGILPLS